MSEVKLARNVVIDGVNHPAGSTVEVDADRKKELNSLGLLDDGKQSASTDDGQEAEKVLAEANEQAAKILQDARAEAEKVKADAQEQADKTVSDANAEAEKVRSQAQQDADKAVQDARAEAEKVKAASKPAGK